MRGGKPLSATSFCHQRHTQNIKHLPATVDESDYCALGLSSSYAGHYRAAFADMNKQHNLADQLNRCSQLTVSFRAVRLFTFFDGITSRLVSCSTHQNMYVMCLTVIH